MPTLSATNSSNLSSQFHGVFTALVTPFLPDYSIDYKNLELLLEEQIKAKVSGVVVSGTTGESPTLSKKEKQELLKFTLDKCKGKCLVIAGTGSNDTKKTIEDSLSAEKAGADGLLIVTPYYNKPTQAGLLAHYQAISNEVQIPILLYNVPGRTGVSLSAKTIAALSFEKNIIGIKEATGNISFLSEIRSAVLDENFVLLSGDDPTFWPFLCAGGHGIISVASNILPGPLVSIWKFYQSKIFDRGLKLSQSLHDWMGLLFIEANPIPIKWLLSHEKKIQGILRLPLVGMDEGNAKKLLKSWDEVKSRL